MGYTPKTRPFPHQAKATVRLAKRKNYALFMEPRTGKTKSALDAVAMLAQAGKLCRVLVLCPLIAKDVWEDQIRQHFPFPAHLEDHEIEWLIGSKRDGPCVHFYLLNYDRFRQRWQDEEGDWHYDTVKEIEAWKPDVIICDESHRLKRAGGVTAQAVWRMVRRQRKKTGKPWVWLLTGTPSPKGWTDLFAQFRVMDDTIFGTNKQDFINRYVKFGYGKLQYTVVEYFHEKEILKKVHEHAFTCTAEEAGMAGEQFWQKLWVELPPKARKAYQEMVEEFITELEGGEIVDASNAAVKRLRLLQITGGFTTAGGQIHDAKLVKVRAYLEDLLEQSEPVVLYARHLNEVHALAESAEKVGFLTDLVYGATKQRDRTRAINDFQRPRRPHIPRAIVFQVQTGSLAIELSRAAEVVFYSVPDGWETYFQCLNRVMGPNQKRPVRYTHILARDTLDISVITGLIQKEDWHRILLKDPRRYLYGFDTME